MKVYQFTTNLIGGRMHVATAEGNTLVDAQKSYLDQYGIHEDRVEKITYKLLGQSTAL